MLSFLTMTPRYQDMILFAIGFITFFMSRIINNAALDSRWLAVIIIYDKVFFFYLNEEMFHHSLHFAARRACNF